MMLLSLTKRNIRLINNHLFSLDDAIGLRPTIDLSAKGSGTKTLCNDSRGFDVISSLNRPWLSATTPVDA
ncbi:Hypothetical protein SynRCC307_1057 [Synechococcus sp. RCC307]|nr:Hypothetical protein SynRCC307_1057 [Synechococcus sp. RCC307]